MYNKYKKEEIITTPFVPNKKHVDAIDVDWLKQLFDFQTPTGNKLLQANYFTFINDFFIKFHNIECKIEKDTYGNIYITKGYSTNYQCVISHIDTVHDFDADFRSYEAGDYIIGVSNGEQCGLGADPKCGVYLLLELLKRTEVIKCVLFLNEEQGCIGSKEANMSFFEDCSFVMQYDRRSYSNDVIEHTNGVQVLNEEFKQLIFPIMQEFDYNFNHGTCTDVGQLRNNGLLVNCFNISNGSLDEHSDNEKCSLPHLLNALNFGIDVIERMNNVNIKFPLETNKTPKNWWNNKPKGYYDTTADDTYWDGNSRAYDRDGTIDDEEILIKGIYEGETIEADEMTMEFLLDNDCEACEMMGTVMNISASTKTCIHCGVDYHIPQKYRKNKLTFNKETL